jgi:DNA processing protein
MNNNDIKYWIGFNIISGIGRVRFAQLENYFNSLAIAWQADSSELKRAGLDKIAINAIVDGRPGINLDREVEELDRKNVQVLTYHDSRYPSRLHEVYDYPPLIYVRGSLLPQDEWCVAVVGTRRATAYGRQVTEEIVKDLTRNRITIVSGLARGIDSVAYRSALSSGGRTIAICACGLDNIYPPENGELAYKIISNGALISEYPVSTKPKPEYFPRRNRILSGLSMGVLVVEAGESSGAVITAHLALEQNREVFAIPGSILSPASAGTNRLIQEGAKLVSNCNDILEELNLTTVARQIEMKEVIPPTETETTLLKYLSHEPVHIDDVCRIAGLSMAIISSTLAMMELKGMVKQVGNMNYVLCRETHEEYKVKLE